MKKLLIVILAVMLVFGMAVTSFADEEIRGEGEHDHKLMNGADMDYHFEECQVCFERFNVKDHIFKDGICTFCGYSEPKNPFTDVSESAWYYSDVITAYVDKLINGKTETKFEPDLNITYVEAIKLAACMHQKYTTGKVTLTVGNPWYAPYLEYCIENGILREEHGYDLSAQATRQGYMRIFAYSLPAEALEEINFVAENAIPDVKNDPAIYKLYRAGIVGGVDAARNCNPNANIKRSEVAAVLTRMMNKAARIEFTLGEKPVETEPLRFTGASSYSYYGQYVFSVTAEGGKAPHIYTWYCKDGGKESVIEHGAFAILETENVGKNDGIIAFPFKEDNPYLGKQLKLVVTDANGESIDTGYTDIPAYFEVEAPEEEAPTVTYEKLTITKQPEYVAKAEDGMLIYYEVSVDGGKAPYNYEWFYYTGTKNLTAPIENGEFALVDEGKLGLGFYLDSPYISKRFACKVTDANGESVVTNMIKMPDAPFTMEIESIDKISLGTIVVGRVKTGTLLVGESVAVCYDDKYTYGIGKVEKIEMFNKALDKAEANDRVGILLPDFGTVTTRDSLIRTYDEMGLIGDSKNIVIKKPVRAGISYTPRGDIGDWTTVTAYAHGGKEPYTYEWQIMILDGQYISLKDFTNSSAWANGFDKDTLNLQVREEQYTKGYAFRCMVTDANGSVAYTDAKIPTPYTLIVGKHPESVYANYGEKVEFTVKAYGSRDSELKYQWQYTYDGAKTFRDILPTDSWASGYDTDTLTLGYVEKTDFVSHVHYRCVVTDGDGNEDVTNAAAVKPDKPFIIKQPEKVTAKPDTYIKFSVLAEGRCQPLSYQWYFYVDGMDGFLPVSKDHAWADGENTNTLTVGVDRKYFDGSFKCYCVVTDANGNEVKSLEGTVLLSDDATVNLETGHVKEEQGIVLIW
ncbi:MAG: S-layer homology domain-containing protein [Clostridia bacterium]|nr:S-layer homology domain-containing protein [Clostridia bacterium]